MAENQAGVMEAELMAESAAPRWSICIPTLNRPDTLDQCLAHLAALDYDLSTIEVLMIDNGAGAETARTVAKHTSEMPLEHLVNQTNRGLGYSINRGFLAARGSRVVSMNDDALVPPNFLRDLDALFDSDPAIGCIGCRAIEQGYNHEGEGIGRIDDSGLVVGNFVVDCGAPIEVEHIYGFCYAVSRRALELAGANDDVLLAQPYSSGDRLEADQCLSIREAGMKVIYDPRIAVVHLALPRPDMPERTLKWRRHSVRNTLYLFLKHFGLFGRRGLALRYALFHDPGIRSALLRPSKYNWAYAWAGLLAKGSAFGHYLCYLGRRAVGRPAAPHVAAREPIA